MTNQTTQPQPNDQEQPQPNDQEPTPPITYEMCFSEGEESEADDGEEHEFWTDGKIICRNKCCFTTTKIWWTERKFKHQTFCTNCP